MLNIKQYQVNKNMVYHSCLQTKPNLTHLLVFLLHVSVFKKVNILSRTEKKH